MTENFLFKKDKYQKAREGGSKFLTIFCGKCEEEILLYQKDGSGNLFRLYLDRIVAPLILTDKLKDSTNKLGIKNLICNNCNILLAIPMLYEKEDRVALRILGPIKKVINKRGIFPYKN